MPVNLYKPRIIEHESMETLLRQISDTIEDGVINVQGEHGLARILLCGGETPLPLYSKLAQSVAIDWSSVELYQSDERYIDSESQDSNQKKIKQAFGDDVIESCREAQFIRTDLPITESVEDYNEKLDSLDDVWFDVAILGIGPDGHIASLFPGNNYIKHQEKAVIPTIAPSEFAVRERISLTIESLLNAREIYIMMVGDNKINALSEMMEGNMSVKDFPAKALFSHPKVTIFCCFQ
jgi:6-phosphogluconolactonase